MMARSSVGTLTDGRAHLHRAVVPGGDAGGDHHHVVVDIGAGAMLRQHREIAECRQRRRAAAGDDRDRNLVRLEKLDRARQEIAGAGRLVRIGHQPLEADARQVHREPAKLARRLAATARRSVRSRYRTRSGSARRGRGGRRPPRGRARPCRCRRPRQAASLATKAPSGGRSSLLPTMLKVRRMSSVTPASMKTSRLAELLAGDADRAGRHLHLGDLRDLVRLDMRPVADALLGNHALERARYWLRADRDGS